MNTHTGKTQDGESRASANRFSDKEKKTKASDSTPVTQKKAQQAGSGAGDKPGSFPAKAAAAENRTAQPVPAVRKNQTGLPDGLKNGIENLSGHSLDDVKVHYRSGKPAQLQAHAYAQGTDIHIAPGQEKHLPHEAWHVVQQKQGRVKPTLQLKGIPVNDDGGLEKEADVMGQKALQAKWSTVPPPARGPAGADRPPVQRTAVVQRVGEEMLESLLSPIGLITAVSSGAALMAYAWWPAGRYPQDLFWIAKGIGFMRLRLAPDVLALARMPWSTANVLQLANYIGANANGPTVNEWINLAGTLNVQNPGTVRDFAGIPQWGFDSIRTLAQNFVAANPGNHGSADWATIASRVNTDDHPGATALARLNGWSYGAVNTLAQNRAANNPGNFTASQWAAIAAQTEVDSHTGATALARLAGWSHASILTLSQNRQAANPRGFTSTEWAGIAAQAPVNDHAAATEFARMAVWAHNHIVALTLRFTGSNPAGRSSDTWLSVAGLAGFIDRPDSVFQFLSLPPGWSDVSLIGLARYFSLNNGNRGAAAWHDVADAHVNLHGHREAVAAFVRMGGWNNPSLIALATNYAGNNPNNFTYNQWSNLAEIHLTLRNQAAHVAEFARMPNWTYHQISVLATEFGAGNPRNFTVTEWINIANSDASFYNNPALVTPFARMAGWNHANIVALARLFALNANGHTAAQWVDMANAHIGLRNREADVARFACMAGWTSDHVETLVALYCGNNPRNFTVAQWTAIAVIGNLFQNVENNVASFARMANWTHAGILTLAGHFQANRNNRTADGWVLIANAHAVLYNQGNDVRDFALINHAITDVQLVAVATHLLAAINTAQSVALINRMDTTLNGARIQAVVTAVVDINNLVTASQGTAGGQTFSAIVSNLLGNGWTAANVALAVDRMTTPGNPPGANVFCGLLDLAHRRHGMLTAARMLNVLGNINPGNAGDWATAIAEFDEFANAGHAQPAGPFGMGGALVGTSYLYYNHHAATPIHVEVSYLQQRLNHFNAGHSYNSFHFTHANTHRAGSPYSFWAPGTNVQNRATTAIGMGLPAQAATAVRNNAYTASQQASYGWGFEPHAVVLPLVANQSYEAQMSQFYPLGANLYRSINSDVLDIVGRLMGHY